MGENGFRDGGARYDGWPPDVVSAKTRATGAFRRRRLGAMGVTRLMGDFWGAGGFGNSAKLSRNSTWDQGRPTLSRHFLATIVKVSRVASVLRLGRPSSLSPPMPQMALPNVLPFVSTRSPSSRRQT